MRAERAAQRMSEDELLRQVLKLARLLGWRSAHFRPARTAEGWRTAVQGDGKGFPDLFLVRGPRILAPELKGEKGCLSPEQALWLEALGAAGVEVYVWRPEHWRSGEIERVLRGEV